MLPKLAKIFPHLNIFLNNLRIPKKYFFEISLTILGKLVFYLYPLCEKSLIGALNLKNNSKFASNVLQKVPSNIIPEIFIQFKKVFIKCQKLHQFFQHYEYITRGSISP